MEYFYQFDSEFNFSSESSSEDSSYINDIWDDRLEINYPNIDPETWKLMRLNQYYYCSECKKISFYVYSDHHSFKCSFCGENEDARRYIAGLGLGANGFCMRGVNE
jgi:hypothetical protein